jgi:hypothetical protein
VNSKTQSRNGETLPNISLSIDGTVSANAKNTTVQIFVDGMEAWSRPVAAMGKWHVDLEHTIQRPHCLGWNLEPLKSKKIVVLVVARAEGSRCEAVMTHADVE